MPRPEPLPDTWYGRDFLVLREVARRVETNEPLDANSVAQALGLDPGTVGKAGTRLKEDGYLHGGEAMGFGVTTFTNITAKGRREVGQWPSPDVGADRLAAALQAIVDQTPEGPEKTRRQQIVDGVLGFGRDVLVGVATNVITGQIPM